MTVQVANRHPDQTSVDLETGVVVEGDSDCHLTGPPAPVPRVIIDPPDTPRAVSEQQPRRQQAPAELRNIKQAATSMS